MIQINYDIEKDKFLMTLKDDDLFTEQSNFFRSISIYYDKKLRAYPVKGEEIFTMLLWFDRYNYQFTIDPEGMEVLETNPWFPEIKPVHKRRALDLSIVRPGKVFSFLQKKDLLFLVSKDRVCNFNDPGLGKTIEGLYWIIDGFKNDQIDGAIITIPGGIAYQWIYEALDWFEYFNEEDFAICTNETKVKFYDQVRDKKVLIIPDNQLADTLASYRKDYTRSKKLGDLKWDKSFVNLKEAWGKNKIAFLADEAQDYKDPTALKTKALFSILPFIDKILLQTATPFIREYVESWVYFYLMNPGEIGMSKNAFTLTLTDKVGAFGPYSVRWEDYKPEAIKDVDERLKKYSIKRLKKDDPDMKFKKIQKPNHLRMSYLQEQIYRKVADYYMLKVKKEGLEIKGYKDIENKFPYLISSLENPLLLKDAIDSGDLKAPEVERLLTKWTARHDERFLWLDEYLKDIVGKHKQKVLIFDHRPGTLDMLYERLKKYNPLIDHGKIKRKGTKDEHLRDLKEKFNDPNSPHRILLASDLTMSAGVNLEKGGNKTVFYSMGHALSVSQGQDRQYRFSNTKDAYVTYLIYEKTLDDLRYRRTMGKIELNNNKQLTVEEIKNILEGRF